LINTARHLTAFCVLLVLLAASCASGTERASASSDKDAVLTFAFFGCNRIDHKDWLKTRSSNPSSANVPQLRRNLYDISRLNPNLVFVGGDMVMGYEDDNGATLKRQLEAWSALVRQIPLPKGCELTAVAGNHELNRKVGDRKLPLPAADALWTDWVKANHLIPPDAAGPGSPFTKLDLLATDQSVLNFTFRRGAVQFVILNTDTRVTEIDHNTGETRIAEIPVWWLTSQLDLAEQDPTVKCVVVMGHRNLVDPQTIHGDSPVRPASAEKAVRALLAHSKVRAYICAHVHGFEISRIGSTELRQVIFGNGGSPLEPDWKPAEGRTFGFGFFKVYADGSLGVVPYLRPEPKNYLEDSPAAVLPAKPQRELILRPRSASTE
jgi:hypothetical protein